MALESTHASRKDVMTYIMKSLTHTMFIILMLIIIIMDTTTKYLLGVRDNSQCFKFATTV